MFRRQEAFHQNSSSGGIVVFGWRRGASNTSSSHLPSPTLVVPQVQRRLESTSSRFTNKSATVQSSRNDEVIAAGAIATIIQENLKPGAIPVRVVVSKIPKTVGNSVLKDFFEAYGTVSHLQILGGKGVHQTAFVDYSTHAIADEVLADVVSPAAAARLGLSEGKQMQANLADKQPVHSNRLKNDETLNDCGIYITKLPPDVCVTEVRAMLEEKAGPVVDFFLRHNNAKTAAVMTAEFGTSAEATAAQAILNPTIKGKSITIRPHHRKHHPTNAIGKREEMRDRENSLRPAAALSAFPVSVLQNPVSLLNLCRNFGEVVFIKLVEKKGLPFCVVEYATEAQVSAAIAGISAKAHLGLGTSSEGVASFVKATRLKRRAEFAEEEVVRREPRTSIIIHANPQEQNLMASAEQIKKHLSVFGEVIQVKKGRQAISGQTIALVWVDSKEMASFVVSLVTQIAGESVKCQFTKRETPLVERSPRSSAKQLLPQPPRESISLEMYRESPTEPWPLGLSLQDAQVSTPMQYTPYRMPAEDLETTSFIALTQGPASAKADLSGPGGVRTFLAKYRITKATFGSVTAKLLAYRV